MSTYDHREEEYYVPGRAGGVQEYINEALGQTPWWLISVAAHGVLAVLFMLISFTEIRVDEHVVIDTALEEKLDDPLTEKHERDIFKDDRSFDNEEPPIEDPVIKDAEFDDHNETDDNEDNESSKGLDDAMSDKPFQGKFTDSVIGVGGGVGGTFGGPFGGRRNLKARGSNRHSESAVLAGLEWLARHQNPDGMWSAKKYMMNCRKGTCAGAGSSENYDMGVTGLAMLAFLGAGHSHKHGKYKNVVKTGIKAMKDRQTPDGCFGPKDSGGHWIYNHTIATMAAAEAYGMADKSPLLHGMAQKAVDFLIECQNPYLGWRYGVKPGESDSSVTGWAVLALKSARIAGLNVPEESFEGALKWFDKVTDESYYRTGYSSKGDPGSRLAEAAGKFQPAEAMTAAAVISKIFILGKSAAKRPEVLGGAALIKASPPRWDVKGGTIDMYYWYYGTLAMFQLGGQYWKTWEEGMKNAIVPTQRRGGCEDGSWDPACAWGIAGGRVYSTAINVLSLEIYYRYARILQEK